MKLLSAVVLSFWICQVCFEWHQSELKTVKSAEVIEVLWEDIEKGFKDDKSIWISFDSSKNIKKKKKKKKKVYECLLLICHIRLSCVFSAIWIFLTSSLTVCFFLIFSSVWVLMTLIQSSIVLMYVVFWFLPVFNILKCIFLFCIRSLTCHFGLI